MCVGRVRRSQMHSNDGTGEWEVVGTFAEKVATARDEVAQLKQAIARADEPSAVAAAIRLRRAVEIVERAAVAVGVGQADMHRFAAAKLQDLQVAAYPLLDQVPTQLSGIVATRRFLARFDLATLDHLRDRDGVVDARRETIADVSIEHVDMRRARLGEGTLRDVRAARGLMDDIDCEGATLLRVGATAAAMWRADLRSCHIEHCDFSWANLERSNWRDASVFSCMFVGTVLVDVLCDDALFVDCDLRGADLSAIRAAGSATAVGARFLRCDLRETRWQGRDLGGVSFIDCRMHGVTGPALADEVHIVRPDVSAMGDGSSIVAASAVADAWSRS